MPGGTFLYAHHGSGGGVHRLALQGGVGVQAQIADEVGIALQEAAVNILIIEIHLGGTVGFAVNGQGRGVAGDHIGSPEEAGCHHQHNHKPSRNLEEITSEEIQELINACTNDRDRLLIAMMAETGLRLGEILGIHYTEDIDFERRTVRVRYRESNTNLARAKNAEYRMALLSNTTFEFLVKYISDNRKSLMNSEYLFTKLTGKNKGEPLDADSVYSMLKRLSKKTDINSHPHQLRHYFAEERRKEGWDLNDIRFALGHKKVETTIKYLGENNERLIEATDQYYSNNEDLYQIADFL